MGGTPWQYRGYSIISCALVTISRWRGIALANSLDHPDQFTRDGKARSLGLEKRKSRWRQAWCKLLHLRDFRPMMSHAIDLKTYSLAHVQEMTGSEIQLEELRSFYGKHNDETSKPKKGQFIQITQHLPSEYHLPCAVLCSSISANLSNQRIWYLTGIFLGRNKVKEDLPKSSLIDATKTPKTHHTTYKQTVDKRGSEHL